MSETAMKLVLQIKSKIDDAIRPLQTEMELMKWDPEYQFIIWEALAQKAASLAIESRMKMDDKP